MNTARTLSVSPIARSIAVPGFAVLFRALVQKKLKTLAFGSLTMLEEGGRKVFEGKDRSVGLDITVHIYDARVYSLMALRGSIGAGEAFMLGYWSCDDLTGLVRLLLLNRSVLEGVDSGLTHVMAPLLRTYHRFRENTRRGSVKNISDHYDLGNAFFSRMLDPTMMYSCAMFQHADDTLEQASVAKVKTICEKLHLKATDHILEIGTGWGFFAAYAAKHYGCRVTTTTISKQQYEVAAARMEQENVGHRVTILQSDYRDLQGQFDKVVSIEMIEAVGHLYYEEYFAACSRCLKPDGQMLLQAIIIDDAQYERAIDSVDFIQRYIFPGSCIPSIAAISKAVGHATDLRLFDLEDITANYPRTLATWRANLKSHREELHRLGYDDVFIRMMEFYLCYCEGGFLEGSIGDVQMLFNKPFARRL